VAAGSEAERITRMILTWEEQNPNTPQEFKDNLDSIGRVAMEVGNMLKRFNLSLEEQGEIMKLVSERAGQDAQKMLAGHKWQYDYAIKAAKSLDTERERIARADERRAAQEKGIFDQWQHRIQGWSRTAGWMGYRLMMMGRVITRWFTGPLQHGQRVLQQWEQTMLTVATGMGLAAIAGRDYSDSLGPLLEDLPQLGIESKAAWSVVQSMVAGISTLFAGTSTDAMFMIADSLQAIWDALAEAGVPEAFDEFVKTHLPGLLTAIEEFMPGFATGIIDGLTQMTPLITALLENVDGEALGRLAGYLLPLAPALTALGIALFFLSPALMILKTLFGILGWGVAAAGGGAAAGGAAGAATGAGVVLGGAAGAAAIPVWVPVLGAIIGAIVGAAIVEGLKRLFPWAVGPEAEDWKDPTKFEGIPGPASGYGKMDLWKMLMGPGGEGVGQPSMAESLAIIAANQGASVANIYGDIYFPEGMTYEELVQYLQDVINSESKGYPPATAKK